MDDRDWTVDAVAKHLQVGQETVRIWLRKGRFPNAYRLPSRAGWRIPKKDVDALKKVAA
jgi:excisionase family DNA binding protein